MVEIVLFPIIYVMRAILEFGHAIFGHYGPAIIVLSIAVTAATQPLGRFASRIQKAENERQKKMKPEVQAAKAKYKGEKQFREIEAIYKRYNYHPIHSIKEIFGVVLQIPFLLAALLLLYDYEPIRGQSFLLIADLSQPDRLLPLPAGLPLESINLLPFFTAVVSIWAGYFMSNIEHQSRWKGNIVAIVILFLIYTLPSAVVLYWCFNNLWLLMTSALAPRVRKMLQTKSVLK